jgi:hypothetical protein
MRRDSCRSTRNLVIYVHGGPDWTLVLELELSECSYFKFKLEESTCSATDPNMHEASAGHHFVTL